MTASRQDPTTAVGLESRQRSAVQPRRAFRSLAELTPIFGDADGLLARVAPFVTVIGRSGTVNPAVAPEDVLASVPDISNQEVAVLRNARETGRILDPDARAIVAKYRRYFETAGEGVYNIEVEGASSRVRRSTIALDPHGDAPFHILAWNW